MNSTFDVSGLDAMGYTFVSMLIDQSSSVENFSQELFASFQAVLKACQESPCSENLLLRPELFSSEYEGGVKTLHDYMLISEIDSSQYDSFKPYGATPLINATHRGLTVMKERAGDLESENDCSCNGILFLLTDGLEWNGDPRWTTQEIKALKEEMCGEDSPLESLITVILGINTDECREGLMAFKDECGIDHFLEAGSSHDELMKVAKFMSSSVMSQSKSVGTGQAAPVKATI